MRNAHRINYKVILAQYIVYVKRNTLYLENKKFPIFVQKKKGAVTIYYPEAPKRDLYLDKR